MMLRWLLPFTLVLVLSIPMTAQPVGIANGIPMTMAPDDTVSSTFLPSLPMGTAGEHGFVQTRPDGSFAFADGTPARFFGVTIQWTSAFPDSTTAITVAARLRKLGINMVRFRYIDFSYDWAQSGSFLDVATGFRSLREEQIRRFDWLVYQLKQHGIYSYLTLQSARAPRPEDGLSTMLTDSALWLGRGFYHLYPQARAAHKRVAGLLLNHINPFTGVAYKSEPAIAAIEMMEQGSLLSLWAQNVTHYAPGQSTFSWHQSRRLDTLFAAYLQKKYGSNSALATAWSETPPSGGYPNLISEGSFEGNFEQVWQINGALTPVLATDSVFDGQYALRLRLSGTSGNIYNSSMIQTVPLEFNKLYRISFWAKCSNPEGRTVRLLNSTLEDNGLSGGLLADIQVTPYWKQHEAYFLVPVKGSTTPLALAFFFGDKDGEISFDNIQLRRATPAGLQAGESVTNASVVRIPWGHEANYLASSQRVEDQSAFYMSLERDYFNDLRRYVVDTVGTRQPVTGAASYWASGLMESSIQGTMDFSAVQTGWDWVSSEDGRWRIRNYSPLRQGYAGPVYDVTTFAHAHQPLIAALQQPFPNRYQSETMMMFPLYALLQGWDGVVWDNYLDDREDIAKDFIDSARFTTFSANPAMLAMMPAMSSIFRNGLVEPARTTLNIQHSAQQPLLMPRMQPFWGRYGLPGQMPGLAMAANRIVTDSLDASYFTQRNDLGFDYGSDGEIRSDTRQLRWEYNNGVLSVNSPMIQGASGFLSRSDGVSLDLLDINVQSLNETATVLWTPLDADSPLATSQGPSLLTIVTRTEPTGWHWIDSTTADRWGISPMLLDPVRVRLTFHSMAGFFDVAVTPLDASGNTTGTPITASGSGSYTLSLDQATTGAAWYSVEFSGIGTSVPTQQNPVAASIAAQPNITSDRTQILITLPQAEQSLRVELLDMLGRTVHLLHDGAVNAGTTSLALDASDIPPGYYMVKAVSTGGKMISASVVIVR